MRTIYPLVALTKGDQMRIKVSQYKGRFGGKQSTAPVALISRSGQLMLNTYISKLFGVTPKTKTVKVAMDYEPSTKTVRILFDKVKPVEDAFPMRNAGYRDDADKSVVGQLMYGMAMVWKNDELGIHYPYRHAGNHSFPCTIVTVSKKDQTPWGIEFSLESGFAAAEANVKAKAEAKAQAKQSASADDHEIEDLASEDLVDDDDEIDEEEDDEEQDDEEDLDDEDEEEEEEEEVRPSRQSRQPARQSASRSVRRKR